MSRKKEMRIMRASFRKIPQNPYLDGQTLDPAVHAETPARCLKDSPGNSQSQPAQEFEVGVGVRRFVADALASRNRQRQPNLRSMLRQFDPDRSARAARANHKSNQMK